MKKTVLLLFCFFCISELSAQVVESDRQIGWRFIGLITQIVMLCAVLICILFGTLAFIGYRGKPTKKKIRHKKRRRKHSSQENNQQGVENEPNNEDDTKILLEEQSEDTPIEAHHKKHSKYKQHQITKKHKNRFSKHKKWFRGVAFLSFLVFLFAFYMYIWAEREKNRPDDPAAIPPEFMW